MWQVSILPFVLGLHWLSLALLAAAGALGARSGRGCCFRFCLILFFATVRFGEAAHPGPADFVIGALNATGLQGKHSVVSQLPAGLYAASETHLTPRGVTEFNKGLHFAQSGHRLVPGHPARHRARSAFVGDYTGVGFISSVPTRTACHAWHPDVYSTARLQVVHAFASPLWILAGVCYGFASGPVSKTLQLLEHLSDRVVDSATGPRVLAGDFNLLEDHNPFVSHWRSRGFIEIQQLWACRTGQPLRVTCKHSTRKDFVYVSPELVPFIMAVEVCDDWFADHSLLLARLQLPAQRIARPVWRTPKHRPLPAAAAKLVSASAPQSAPALEGSAGDRYAFIWGRFEDRVSTALAHSGHSPLTSAERGRGCTLDVSICNLNPAPLRKPRQGEVEPQYFGLNRRYGFWFRQLRRLQALTQSMRNPKATDDARLHRAQTWHAVVRAPGFHPDFSAWWRTRPHKAFHAPACIPAGLPDPSCVLAIFQCFEANFRSFEKSLLVHRKAAAKARRDRMPSLIFRDVQRDKACPVTTLVEGPQAEAVHVDQEDFSVEVADNRDWSAADPVFLDGVPFMPLHVEPDKLWLDKRPPPAVTMVHQERLLATLPELFRAFGDAWSERWLRHSDTPSDGWRQALAMMDLVAPPPTPLQYAPVTATQWRQAVRAKKPTSVPGPDGVSRADLLLMPDDLLAHILAVCEQAEHTGEWPMAAMTAVVSALEKLPGAGRVGQFRPISVLSFTYRVWASVRAKQVLAHISHMLPPSMYGMVPGKSSRDVWYAMQHLIEVAHLAGEPLCGVVSDLQRPLITSLDCRCCRDLTSQPQVQGSELCWASYRQPYGLP